MSPQSKIKYYDGYKYQLAEDYSVQISIVGYSTEAQYIVLRPDGLLTIKEGYAWDGPSGPTLDTKSSMRGSLVHDALYQLIREGFLPKNYRDEADNILFHLCKEDGMWGWRAWLWILGVKKFASSAADWKSEHQILSAP